MKLVTFAGAQSTGKTTLLKELKSILPSDRVEYVDEVTRRLKKEYGVNINEDGSVLTQYLIMADHLQNALRPGADGTVLKVLDRGALDGLIYTEWLLKQVTEEAKEVDWLKCHRHAINIFNLVKSKYDLIFYTDHADVEVEDDGERSIDIEFRADVIRSFKKRINDFSPNLFDRVVVLRGSVDQRMDTILENLQKIGVAV